MPDQVRHDNLMLLMTLPTYLLYLAAVALLRSSTPIRWINRVCGGLFTLMGGLLLLTRRSA
jgi:threonine/homoserine/homoserine lactone efflux protein